jgi:hypothetical protein
MFSYFSRVDNGFEYRTFGLLLCLSPSRNSLNKQNRRRENCYSIPQLGEVEVLSATDENSFDLCSLGSFRLRSDVAKKITESVSFRLSLVRCLLYNDPAQISSQRQMIVLTCMHRIQLHPIPEYIKLKCIGSGHKHVTVWHPRAHD